jgi:hypothetical protein
MCDTHLLKGNTMPAPKKVIHSQPVPMSEFDRIDMAKALDHLDRIAVQMELRYGVGRLPLLVPTDMAVRFMSQYRKLEAAIKAGYPAAITEHAGRMANAWVALDRAAAAAVVHGSPGGETFGAVAPHGNTGAPVGTGEVWETVTGDGTVVQVVQTPADAARLVQGADPRRRTVWTLEEIANVLTSIWPELVKTKQLFPGAAVENARAPVVDDLFTPDSECPF